MTKPCPPDLAAFKHELADYEQPVGRVPWTAGPWDVREEFGTLCVVDELGDYIADINDRETYDENLEVEDEDGSSVEAEANARLIASAPALYEALESIAEYWNRDRNDSAMHDACWHAINTAEDALSLARGETSHG